MRAQGGRRPARRQLTTAGILLGIGLGGFVDGIVLHQILQWHHMLSSTGTDNVGLRSYPASTVHGLEVNTLWDGLFHLTAWLFVLAGLVLLWRAVQRGQGPATGRELAGLLLAGWGAFNLVEGIVDHHLLGIHHVRPGPGQTLYDLGFLALGLVLLLAGWALHRPSPRRSSAGRERARRGEPA